MRTEKSKIILSLVAAMTIWAMSFIWSKQAFLVFSPITIVFIRLLVSSALVFSFIFITKQFQTIRSGDLKWFLLLGFFEPFLYFIGESYGLLLISSTLASVIVSTIPLFTPLAGFLVFRERISYMNVAGIVISVVGVLFMVVDKDLALNAPIAGILLMGLAVFSATVYALLLKHLSHNYTGYTIVGYQNIVGIVLFAPIFFFYDWDKFTTANITPQAIKAVLLLAVFASTIAFVLYTYGIRHLGVTKANVFVNLIPVLTAFFAWYFLDEVINWQKAIGIAIVIIGLFASQFTKNKDTDVRPYEA